MPALRRFWPLPSVAAASLCLCFALPALLAGCGPNIPSSIKIGVAQPISGPSADRGQDLVHGVNLAVKEINAAGFKVAGKPVTIEVVVVDDKAEISTAKQVAQQLVDQKVAAVIGHLSSETTEAAIPIYKQAKIPQLFTSSAVELSKLGEGNTFRLVANDALQAQAVAGYISTTLKAAKVAMIYEDTSYGAPLAKDVAASLAKQGKTLTVNTPTDTKRTDFAEFVGQLKAAPPDALVTVLRDHQLLPLFEALQAAQLTNIPLMATSVAKTRKMVSAPVDIKSFYLTSSALTPREFVAGPSFTTKFRAAYNSDPVWAAHYAYDAVYVLADAMRSADSVDPQAIRERLHKIDANAPVTSNMRFNAEGEQSYATVTVYRRRNGEWEPQMRSDKW